MRSFDIGQFNRTMVLDNDVVFGTVNANRAHYEMAADALARADQAWLGRLITRRVPLDALARKRSSTGPATSRSSSISPCRHSHAVTIEDYA